MSGSQDRPKKILENEGEYQSCGSPPFIFLPIVPSWDSPGHEFWSIIEFNLGIICGSISTLRPLLSRYLPCIFPSIVPRSSEPTSSFAATTHKCRSNSGTFCVLADEAFLARNLSTGERDDTRMNVGCVGTKSSLGSSDGDIEIDYAKA